MFSSALFRNKHLLSSYHKVIHPKLLNYPFNFAFISSNNSNSDKNGQINQQPKKPTKKPTEILKVLGRHIWPNKATDPEAARLKARVVSALGLLVGAKILTIQVKNKDIKIKFPFMTFFMILFI